MSSLQVPNKGMHLISINNVQLLAQKKPLVYLAPKSSEPYKCYFAKVKRFRKNRFDLRKAFTSLCLTCLFEGSDYYQLARLYCLDGQCNVKDGPCQSQQSKQDFISVPGAYNSNSLSQFMGQISKICKFASTKAIFLIQQLTSQVGVVCKKVQKIGLYGVIWPQHTQPV